MPKIENQKIQERYVIDTCALFPLGTSKRTTEWDEESFRAGLACLRDVQEGFMNNMFYCIPQMLEELDAMTSLLQIRADSLRPNEDTNTFLTLLRRIRIRCQTGIYEWQQEKGERATLGKWIHHWTKNHRPYLDKGKRGGWIQTDRHLMTSTILLGLEAPATLVTHDRDLQESFRDVIRTVIPGGGLEEMFPHPFHIYSFPYAKSECKKTVYAHPYK